MTHIVTSPVTLSKHPPVQVTGDVNVRPLQVWGLGMCGNKGWCGQYQLAQGHCSVNCVLQPAALSPGHVLFEESAVRARLIPGPHARLQRMHCNESLTVSPPADLHWCWR